MLGFAKIQHEQASQAADMIHQQAMQAGAQQHQQTMQENVPKPNGAAK